MVTQSTHSRKHIQTTGFSLKCNVFHKRSFEIFRHLNGAKLKSHFYSLSINLIISPLFQAQKEGSLYTKHCRTRHVGKRKFQV